METTVRFSMLENPNTIPMICETNIIQTKQLKLWSGLSVEGYVLHRPIGATASSEIWYCNDLIGMPAVMKFTSQYPDVGAVQMIREIESEHLVPILDCGYYEEYWFEVYPYYKNGSLQGKLDIQTIKKTVLPAIIKALDALHGYKLIHNDIKPSNLYWSDDMNTVLLGDYGSVRAAKEKPLAITPAYAAPELILNDVGRRASDWASVGLTLATLASGKRLVEADTLQEAMRVWEKQLVFRCEDAELQQLVKGMIHLEAGRRLGPNAAKKWCGNDTFGGEERTARKQEKNSNIITIAFQNPSWIAADIEGLLKGIESHWEYSVFLFGETRMDRFLTQFDNRWVDQCRMLRKYSSKEDALFKLTLELMENQGFIWRGKKYNNLLDLEDTWESGEDGERDVTTFLQKGHAYHYMSKKNASKKQLSDLKALQDYSRINAYEACSQLFQALRGNEGLEWDGTNFRNLEDMAAWLEGKTDSLDLEIESFFESKKFGAWFAFQGMQGVLDDIRRKCR